MDAERLQTIPFFQELGQEERSLVAGFAREVEVPAGKTLTTEGDFGYSYFVIEAGTATVHENGRELAELGPGDFFGEIALLVTGRRTALICSTSAMRLVTLFDRDFRQIEARIPSFSARLRRAMETRVALAVGGPSAAGPRSDQPGLDAGSPP